MSTLLVTGQGGSNNWGGNASPPVSNPVVWISSHDRAPLATDDETKYFGVGSIWLDVSDLAIPTAYMCFDATEGQALWRPITVASGSITDAENVSSGIIPSHPVFLQKNDNTLLFRRLGSTDGSVGLSLFQHPSGNLLDFTVVPSKLSLANLGSKSYLDLDDLPIPGIAADLDISAMPGLESTPGAGMKLVIDAGGWRRKIDWAQLPGAVGGEANEGANVGSAGGVGVYATKSGVTLLFRKLYGAAPMGAASGIVVAQEDGGEGIQIYALCTSALWNAAKLRGVDVDTTAPTADQVLAYDSASGKWKPKTQTATRQIAVFNRMQNASEGTFTSGAWQTRVLQQLSNGISGCSVASNVVSLPAGTYLVRAKAPAYRVNGHCIRLDFTGADVANAYGSSAYSRDSSYCSQTDSTCEAVATFAAGGTVTLKHRCEKTRAGDGLGVANAFSSGHVYAELVIEKLA